MSKQCREIYAFKNETFEKLWVETLFKSQCHTETFLQEFDFGPVLSSMSPLKLICNLKSHT